MSEFLDQKLTRITVLFAESWDTGLSDIYVRKILQERPKFILSDNIASMDYEASLNIVVLLHDHRCLENSTIDFLSVCRRGCTYIVYMTKEFMNEEAFMQETEELVKMLWKKKVANAVIIGALTDTVLLAKSANFEPALLRRPSKPILLGKCDQHSRWTTQEKVMDPIKMDNSSVNVAYFDREPYVKVSMDEEKKFSGLEIWLMRILARNLNMSVNLSEIEWGNGTDFTEEIDEEFTSDRKIDLIIGGILWNPNELTDFTVPYAIVQVVWLVPIHTNISLRALIAPFENSVWYAVGGVLLFAIFLKFIVFRELTFLEILALLMGYGWYKQPTRDSYRINFMSWVIFGYLLTQYYLASLAGQLMAQSELQIETMAELVDSGISYGGLKSHHMMLGNSSIQNDDNDDEDSVIETLSKNFVVFEHDDYEKLFHDLIDGRNTSFALAVALNMSAGATKFNENNVNMMDEILTSAPLAFAVWKGLPYLDLIDQILVRLIQSGIIQYLAEHAVIAEHAHHHDDDDDDEDDTFVDSDDLIPVFLLLAIGLTAGLLCLFLEVVVHLCVKKKKKSKRRRNLQIRKKRRMRNNEKNKRIGRIESIPVLRPNVEVGYTHGYKVIWKEV
ncbi:uncharacterized protein LOC130670414 [Microplitis mediator]|uniref:uncharacterized protein LOC130670414 n=1 Tax=Microplitis mediator TaxID=375433 RepID=UPI002554A228|nr:uncharacterized protein LOC130670414 [Microplitis mediator]